MGTSEDGGRRGHFTGGGTVVGHRCMGGGGGGGGGGGELTCFQSDICISGANPSAGMCGQCGPLRSSPVACRECWTRAIPLALCDPARHEGGEGQTQGSGRRVDLDHVLHHVHSGGGEEAP